MKRILYIGQFSEGTTSKMRAEALKKITGPVDFQIIDTHIPFYKCHPLWRSLAFRYKTGKVLQLTNRYILNNISGYYDVIWVDKAVFITKKTTRILRLNCEKLIHYTPDPAFRINSSRHFYQSLPLYDYVITTKSFEKKDYINHIAEDKLIYIPQGYNRELHYPRHSFEAKKEQVLFIGLHENSREKVIDNLLSHDIPVALAGMNWERYVAKRKDKLLTYLGKGVFGEKYASTVSASRFGLGLVSKRFPELHTTRTFEIPACGTALITERNEETIKYFDEEDVIFYSNAKEMVERIKFFMDRPDDLKRTTNNGYLNVIDGGLDYKEQLNFICKKAKITSG